MQYRQHRRDADAGARQHERTLARFEREAASRRADLEHVANADLAVEISAGRAGDLAFDAHAVLCRVGRARERVAAHER